MLPVSMRLILLAAFVACKTCPGGRVTCDDDNTCCKYLHKQYSCCPLPNAVCCSDLEHCCPQGYLCDNETSACKKPDQTVVLTDLTVFQEKSESRYIKCDREGDFLCPNTFTCCKSPNGSSYNCCPMQNAACCKDGEHCCPSGMKCDFARNECTFTTAAVPPSRTVTSKATKVVCPDGSFTCPVGYSCCTGPDDTWNCCPVPNAVCCKDKVHCCPSGSVCNHQLARCQNGLKLLPWSKKTAATRTP